MVLDKDITYEDAIRQFRNFDYVTGRVLRIGIILGAASVSYSLGRGDLGTGVVDLASIFLISEGAVLRGASWYVKDFYKKRGEVVKGRATYKGPSEGGVVGEIRPDSDQETGLERKV